jgi:hypothetical protein
MIKFFRKIRFDLMEKNKTGKYFKYAIGEIVLVMIGILLALQVNTWNEQRKNNKQEILILKSFNNIIESDLIEFEKHLNRYTESSNSINYLIDHIEQDLPFIDSLNIHFGNLSVSYQLKVNTSVFENLKSKGFDLISNEVLKNEIISFYDYAQNDLIFSYTNYYWIIDNASKTIYNKHFDAIYEPSSRDMYSLKENPLGNGLKIVMKPNNFEELKNDKEFMYFIKSLRNQQYWFIITNATKMKKDLNNILELIENELVQ